jgi:tRNA-splicing ligase RtcB (3'-phosphate/5'-hydroxy nucleic acid ligase)
MAGPNTIETGYAPIKAWIDGAPVEDAARRQLFNIAALPFIHRHVAAMRTCISAKVPRSAW